MGSFRGPCWVEGGEQGACPVSALWITLPSLETCHSQAQLCAGRMSALTEWNQCALSMVVCLCFLFLMKSCFTSRFYFHKCLFFLGKKSQIIYFSTYSWKALISVLKERAVGCWCVHFVTKGKKCEDQEKSPWLYRWPSPPFLSEYLGLGCSIFYQRLFNSSF